MCCSFLFSGIIILSYLSHYHGFISKSFPILNSLINNHQSSLFLSTIDNSMDYQKYKSLPAPLRPDSQIQALKIIKFVRSYCKETVLNKSVSRSSLKHINSMLKKSKHLQLILLRSNMRLVYSIAMNHQGMGLDINDLIYEGVLGLRKAMVKFDPTKGCAFSTYAYPWIKDYIRAALSKSLPISLPRHVYKLLVKLKIVKGKFFAQYGREPSDEELREELGLTKEKFEIVSRAMSLAASHSGENSPVVAEQEKTVQFDESTWERIISSNSEGSHMDHLQSQEQLEPDEAAFQSDVLVSVFSVLQTLPKEEAAVIYSRLGLGEFVNLPKIQELSVGLDLLMPDISLEAANFLYTKGMRRLKRRLAAINNKYPQFDLLSENILQPLYQ